MSRDEVGMRKGSSQKDLRLPRGSVTKVLYARESCLRLGWWKTMLKDGNRLDKLKLWMEVAA